MKEKIRKLMGLALIMLVFATSIPVTATNNYLTAKKTNDINTKSWVDPNIYLTEKQLPLLQKAVANIDNQTVKEFVEKIICSLQEKKVVRSKDIRSIIESNNLLFRVKTGPIFSIGKGMPSIYPGDYFLWTFTLYLGPVIYGEIYAWDCVTIAGVLPPSFCKKDQQIYIVGFVGGFFVSQEDSYHGYPWYYSVIGVSCLTIIIPR